MELKLLDSDLQGLYFFQGNSLSVSCPPWKCTRQYYEKGASVLQGGYWVITRFHFLLLVHIPFRKYSNCIWEGERMLFKYFNFDHCDFVLKRKWKNFYHHCANCRAEAACVLLMQGDRRFFLPYQLLKATWNGADIRVQQAKFLSQVVWLLTHHTFRISLHISTAQ